LFIEAYLNIKLILNILLNTLLISSPKKKNSLTGFSNNFDNFSASIIDLKTKPFDGAVMRNPIFELILLRNI
jgi:hypothetical protein